MVNIRLLVFKNTVPVIIKSPFFLGKRVINPGVYNVKISRIKRAKFYYYETLLKTDNYERAYRLYSTLKNVYFIDVGVIFKFGKFSIDNREYYILKGPFKNKKKLKNPFAESVSSQHCVVSLCGRDGRPLIRGKDSLIIYANKGAVSIGDFRDISGIIKITVDTQGRGIVVLKTDVETYIKHVLPSEMPLDFPIEALKAQAVVARTYTLANLGKMYYNQPFDFTAFPTSQGFSGERYSISDSVVDITKGIVLFYGHRIANVFYHSTCGGHTENASYVWHTETAPYLGGVKDGSYNYNLTDPVELRMFIETPPDSIFCRMTSNPTILQYIQKNFRWVAVVPADEIVKNVKKFTGKNIGKLLTISPLERGVSGRVIRAVFIGTRKSVQISGEYNIRLILGGLKSSLFVTFYDTDSEGRVKNVIFKGGGSGHGVGMCQVGAGILADRGFKMEDIIRHYFPGVKGVKLY